MSEDRAEANKRACQQCGSTENVDEVWVENEETGEEKGFDLCNECEDKATQYANGVLDSPYPMSASGRSNGRKVWAEMYPGGDAVIEIGSMEHVEQVYLASGEVEAVRDSLDELLKAGESDGE